MTSFNTIKNILTDLNFTHITELDNNISDSYFYNPQPLYINNKITLQNLDTTQFTENTQFLIETRHPKTDTENSEFNTDPDNQPDHIYQTFKFIQINPTDYIILAETAPSFSSANFIIFTQYTDNFNLETALKFITDQLLENAYTD